jgi:hypothetical protein
VAVLQKKHISKIPAPISSEHQHSEFPNKNPKDMNNLKQIKVDPTKAAVSISSGLLFFFRNLNSLDK